VEGVYVTAGAFDGAMQEGVPTGSRGPDTLFGPPSDTYLAAEAGLTWTGGDAGRVGRLAVGAWHHTGTFDRLAGGTRDGASGGYVVLDQTLFRENADAEDDAQGLGAFAVLDAADDDVFEVDHHVAAGLAWTGLLDGRDADVVGLGATWVHFSADAGFPGDGELAIETFYRLQLTPWFSVKPDLQYIVNPSGGAADDALVATLRLEAAF
jgi:porin